MLPAVAYLEVKNLHTHFTKRGGSIFAPEKHIVRAVDGVSFGPGGVNLSTRGTSAQRIVAGPARQNKVRRPSIRSM